MYRRFFRPLLFRHDAEAMHEAALSMAERAGRSNVTRAVLRARFGAVDARLQTVVAGLRCPSPVGLAAGFDKNGRCLRALSCLGFGFLEIGSVSAHPSLGNPRPRLFRLPADEAIVVNYGVPNDGAEVVAGRLSSQPIPVPLGVNLVETNTGQPANPDTVVDEFVDAARPFVGAAGGGGTVDASGAAGGGGTVDASGAADYLALNLNCPNTTGGTSPFDDSARLRELLLAYEALDGLPPVFLKFTAHSDPARMDALLDTVDRFAFVAGFIFNLPPGKAYALRTPTSVTGTMPGTLCGPPTRQLLDDTIAAWYRRIDRDRHCIIGSGGITSPVHAYRKIRLGASLVQLYTGLVFHGPGLVRRINQGLVRLLAQDGLAHISEAVGLDHHNH